MIEYEYICIQMKQNHKMMLGPEYTSRVLVFTVFSLSVISQKT